MGNASKATGQIDLECINNGHVLSLEDQLHLIQPFTYHEVRSAMFSINLVKSPGPDGYGAGFFKVLWKDIGKEISMAVLDFFITGRIPSVLNDTILSLIPKRSLAYNVLFLQDLIKGYNRKNSSPRCAMKLDLSKAYDTIDWDFLENLLNMFCFPSRFINWIMVCLRGSSYSLVLNGRIQGNFKGGKGLR
ncbi:uncharacterized protein LOC133799722 [Humulus lupulus]|uniref:uncharacterized protein LOC133799722 n=1 Tax=Humulus lupulus TaxID=3486 RepID=UPI002B408117|nr:uncharacterized protein LOC133799722 [Humulus lupulus]